MDRSISENKKKSSHFKYDERIVLEYYLLGKGHFPKITNTRELAETFQKSRRTIQREIKRGMVEHETSTCATRHEYNADFAQQNAEHEMTAKGARQKLTNDIDFLERISKLIGEEKHSTYAVIQNLNNEDGWARRRGSARRRSTTI